MNKGFKATLLLVEDDAPQRFMLGGYLTRAGYRVVEADSAEAAVAVAARQAIDLMVSDLRLGGPDGVALLTTLREQYPDLQAIVITAFGTVDDAVRAMRAGAYDFVSKPVDLARLEALIEKALEKGELARENRSLIELLKGSDAFSGLIGESEPLKRVKQIAARVALSRSSVLILGESGTGKEVLARAIHMAGPRNDKPFLTVNCAALPENLIEAELFGHEKGAFTGADSRRKGRFEAADKGTLFLDEVGEIPLAAQVKLLNVLQSGRFERVGGNESIATDVRIIAATNRNLEERIREGAFREDLYYRLNVVPVTMPPLRDRPEDLPLLVGHFLNKYSARAEYGVRGISPEALERLATYPFPGNVRELENWIERAIVLADSEYLTPDDFPDARGAGSPRTAERGPDEAGLDGQVARFESALIHDALAANAGNQSAAARDLHVSERTIRYKISKYGI